MLGVGGAGEMMRGSEGGGRKSESQSDCDRTGTAGQPPSSYVTAPPARPPARPQCPVYFTESRFRQEVFTAQLKTKASYIKWCLSGTALLLDVV